MFYLVGIENGKITSKSKLSAVDDFPEGYKEINQELYESIGVMPCSFVKNDNEITSIDFIEPIIAPEPPKPLTELEKLKIQLDKTNEAIDFLLMGEL